MAPAIYCIGDGKKLLNEGCKVSCCTNSFSKKISWTTNLALLGVNNFLKYRFVRDGRGVIVPMLLSV